MNFSCSTINIPTRITSTSKTLIDNIFYSSVTKSISAGNIATSISDHLTQLIFIPNKSSVKPTTKKIFGRKYTTENLRKIRIAFDKIDWRRTFTIDDKDTNKSFQMFLQTIEKLLNTFCTVTTISKRKQNLKLKPWITSTLTYLPLP